MSNFCEPSQFSAMSEVAPESAVTASFADALSRVLNLLCAHGVFARTDGRFVHSEVSRFLRSDHPMSMGGNATVSFSS